MTANWAAQTPSLVEKSESTPERAPGHPKDPARREVEALRLIAAGKLTRDSRWAVHCCEDRLPNILNKINATVETHVAS